MRRTTPAPTVGHTQLESPDDADSPIPVGSQAWYDWLADARAFAFRSSHGAFTAYKERRGPGREYWKAYRYHAGRLYRIYLGKSTELTLDRLIMAALELDGPELAGTDDRSHGTSQPDATHRRQRKRPTAEPEGAAWPHLLATKLAVPRTHPDMVPRQRLIGLLQNAISQGQRLTLVSAPAGFGKTTLISAGLRHLAGHAIAWLALDEADNRLDQFLAYLIAALERILPGIGDSAWALLRTLPEQPPIQAILTALLNNLATSRRPIVLVLDDYQLITLQSIHTAVALLLEHMPPHMRLIIASRADPPLPLARMRVRGQLLEIRAADLRFTTDETASFFERMGNQLPADVLAALEARTEGWAAGLQLARLSLQHQDTAHIASSIADFSGRHHHVFAYLADEVFHRQPEHVQSFLTQTSVLTRLCGPLCNAVTNRDDGQAMLDYLDHSNLLLIRLDDTRNWYRYHRLFLEFLRDRLEQINGSESRTLLHHRASQWFQQRGMIREAIDHAIQAQAWDDVRLCLTPLMEVERCYDYSLDWPHWLAELPDTLLRADPELCLRLAWILVLTGMLDAARKPLDLAEATWRASDDQPKLGELLNVRAIAQLHAGEIERGQATAAEALVFLPEDLIEQRGLATYVLGHCALMLGQVRIAASRLEIASTMVQNSDLIFRVLAVLLGLARAYYLGGQLTRAAGLCREIIERAGGRIHQRVPGAYLTLGQILYERNELAAARPILQEGITVGQQTGRDRYWPGAYTTLALVLQASGESNQATTLMRQAIEIARALNNPHHIAEVEACQAQLWLAQGDEAAAERWLSEYTIPISDHHDGEDLPRRLARMRLIIHQHQRNVHPQELERIVAALTQLHEQAIADQRLIDQIRILALLACAYVANRAADQALATLHAALLLAEPEGFIRIFVDEGAPMRQLIETYRAGPDHRPESGAFPPDHPSPGYLDRLIDAFLHAGSIGGAPPDPHELLSERERTVLTMLARGQTIHAIADSLVISEHTARTHVRNIYAKLDVHNRIQAVDKARRLDLL